MKERPILFSGPMVRAILEGRKSQTRRECKPEWYRCLDMDDPEARAAALTRCPYGQPGDRLWVRESWQEFWPDEIPAGRYSQHGQMGSPARLPQTMRVVYRADGDMPPHPEMGSANWRPSIHMPRWACRLVLEVKAVRVERLQDIHHNLHDLEAEGVVLPPDTLYPDINRSDKLEQVYKRLWDDINGKGAWAANPWVWVVEFSRSSKGERDA